MAPSQGWLWQPTPVSLSIGVVVVCLWLLAVFKASHYVLVQVISLQVLKREPGYVRYKPEPGGLAFNHKAKAPENTVIFVMSLSQLITAAMVFHQGRPHLQVSHFCISCHVVLGYDTAWHGCATSSWIAACLPGPFREQSVALVFCYVTDGTSVRDIARAEWACNQAYNLISLP